jgi:hypothetical protein
MPAVEASPTMCHAVQQFIGHVMSLRPRFLVAVKRAHNDAQGVDTESGLSREEAGLEDDQDSVKGMARLFLNTTESYAALVAQGREEVRKFA